jgi:hypothetical protein
LILIISGEENSLLHKQNPPGQTKKVKIFIPKNITPKNPVSVGAVPRDIALTGF